MFLRNKSAKCEAYSQAGSTQRETSKDLITKLVNSPTRGPLCLQNGKQAVRAESAVRAVLQVLQV